MKLVTSVVLEYENNRYEIEQETDSSVFTRHGGHGISEEEFAALSLFQWTEGNYSCDCNKSLFIALSCDEDFPEFDCGETIDLLSIDAILFT